jgi:hypothetical protein
LGPLYGIIFSAPALLFIAWYSGLSASMHFRHQAAMKTKEKLTPELFQLHLHDRLSADYRRLMMPQPLPSSELPTYGLVLSNDKFDKLEANLPPDEGMSNYVTALMQHKNKLYEVEVRYRGAKPWHWNHPQKSWKVRVKGNHVMFDGLPTFNFVNTPDPMPFNEQMVLDTAREAGLLTPSYHPFRLLINNAYMGVYFFEGQPDEGLLRHERRMPGSIYSGAGAPINPKTKVSSLFESAANWKKVGAIGDKAKLDMRELDALLSVVRNGNHREFAAFANAAIDLEKFATLDAIDVVFGNNQHDYHQNHKFYFDPYKNRFEPIATDFRDMEHEQEFNRAENPLLLRFKELPEYLTLRNRKVYDFIRSSCAETALSEKVEHWVSRLAPDQDRDPYWDAYELLPVMGTYYRQLVRPMNQQRQSRAAASRLTELRERLRFLRSEIERQDVHASFYRSVGSLNVNGELPSVAKDRARPAPTRDAKDASKREQTALGWQEAVLDVTVHGRAGFHWLEAAPEVSPHCISTEWQLYADRDLDGQLAPGKDLRLAAVEAPSRIGKPDLTLYPGVVLNEVAPHSYRGKVRADPEPRTYRFFLRSQGCMPERFRIVGRNSATYAKRELVVEARASTAPKLTVRCDERPGFLDVGRVSPHAFCFPLVSEDTVRLGPGNVDVEQTRTYTANQTVVIEPGTTLRFADGASMIVYGRLHAEGTEQNHIRFVPSGKLWGGLALQGPSTSGSRFAYVDFERGTRAEKDFFDFPGMVSIHDTKDIRLEHVTLADNQVSDDALHVAYVEDLSLTDSRLERLFSDAVDLEYSTARLDRVTVAFAGDDALDLMGTRADLHDGTLLRCKGNGVSAGERSDVVIQRTLIADSGRAILLKNASSVRATDVLGFRNQVAVRQEPETEWYSGGSSLSVTEFYALKTQTPLEGAKKPKAGTMKSILGPDDLSSLREALLGEGEWNELELLLGRLEQKGGRP